MIQPAVLFILVGVLSLYPKSRDWLIKFSNTAKGTKTEISDTTIMVYRISGIIALIMGIYLLLR